MKISGVPIFIVLILKFLEGKIIDSGTNCPPCPSTSEFCSYERKVIASGCKCTLCFALCEDPKIVCPGISTCTRTQVVYNGEFFGFNVICKIYSHNDHRRKRFLPQIVT